MNELGNDLANVGIVTMTYLSNSLGISYGLFNVLLFIVAYPVFLVLNFLFTFIKGEKGFWKYAKTGLKILTAIFLLTQLLLFLMYLNILAMVATGPYDAVLRDFANPEIFKGVNSLIK